MFCQGHLYEKKAVIQSFSGYDRWIMFLKYKKAWIHHKEVEIKYLMLNYIFLFGKIIIEYLYLI